MFSAAGHYFLHLMYNVTTKQEMAVTQTTNSDITFVGLQNKEIPRSWIWFQSSVKF